MVNCVYCPVHKAKFNSYVFYLLLFVFFFLIFVIMIAVYNENL
jgi:hypothetical protein